MPPRLSSLFNESDTSSSSSDEEDGRITIAEAYKVLDIRSALLDPNRYCTAVQEVQHIISQLYKTREATKEFKTLIEADVHAAIYDAPSDILPLINLRFLIQTVNKNFPQAKRQTLTREYKQKVLQVMRDRKREKRQQQKEKDEAEEGDGEDEEQQQNQRYSYANLPPGCLELIFSHLSNDPYSLARASVACTTWQKYATANSIWERFLTLTFGRLESIERPELDLDNEPGFFCKLFCKFAAESEFSDFLLPWKNDRIICHDSIRWISPETKARILADPNSKKVGILRNRMHGVMFIDAADVVMFLITREARHVISLKEADQFESTLNLRLDREQSPVEIVEDCSLLD